MHILIIPSWYRTEQNPIRGSFFYDQAAALQKAGHRVGMLVPPSKLRSFHGLGEVRAHWQQANTDIRITDENGIPVYRIPWWGWRESLWPWARGPLALKVFDRYVQEQGKPDVLHGHSILYGGYLAAYIGQQRGIPAVVTEHSSIYFPGRSGLLPGQGAFIRYALQSAQQIIAVGASLAEALKRWNLTTDIRVIGNTVDTSTFACGPAPSPPPFYFAIIGNLIRLKGHHDLLSAFANCFRGEPVHLIIVGDGSQRQVLETMRDQLGLSEQVTFLGRIPHEDIPGLLQRVHAVVSASRTETFGVTLIEALACGKPVVATRSGGPEHFVNETNGLLVPVGDVEALTAALREMVDHYDRYDAASIRAECVERFSEAAIIRQLEQVYAGLTEERA